MVIIYKDELIHLHKVLVNVMEHVKSNGVNEEFFQEYENLNICPHHIHRTKAEHKYAIFILAKQITEALAQQNPSEIILIKKRLNELANRTKKETIIDAIKAPL